MNRAMDCAGVLDRLAAFESAREVDRAARDLCEEVIEERIRQDTKWGQQNHPSIAAGVVNGDSVCRLVGIPTEAECKARVEHFTKIGALTWADVLLEEFAETVAAPDEAHRRGELVQVAAVALEWIECIDRRSAKTAAQPAPDAGITRAANGEWRWRNPHGVTFCSQLLGDVQAYRRRVLGSEDPVALVANAEPAPPATLDDLPMWPDAAKARAFEWLREQATREGASEEACVAFDTWAQLARAQVRS